MPRRPDAPLPAATLNPGPSRMMAEGTSPRPILTPAHPSPAAAGNATTGTAAKGGKTPRSNQFAAVNDLARAWPQGRLAEAPAVLAGVIVALSQLVGWGIAFVVRTLAVLLHLMARGLALLASKISRGRLPARGAMIIGWLLLIVIVVGTLGGVGVTRGGLTTDTLKSLWPFHSARPHNVVPYQAPGATCSNPRQVCAPPTELLDGQPSISAAKILSVLTSYKSPAANAEFANALYDLGITYGINPAYALGFFVQESTCGTQGLAVHTLSIGNIRYTASASPVSYQEYQGFRRYSSWRDGAEDWYWLLRTYYLNQGLRDIYDITPIYAPSSDHNNPDLYARTVYGLVLAWSGN